MKQWRGIIDYPGLWAAGQPVSGTVAARYLQGRGICLLPDCLRFLPECRHTPSMASYPALIAAVRRWPSDELSALHRTYLKPDGSGKIDHPQARMMLGMLAVALCGWPSLPSGWVFRRNQNQGYPPATVATPATVLPAVATIASVADPPPQNQNREALLERAGILMDNGIPHDKADGLALAFQLLQSHPQAEAALCWLIDRHRLREI